MREVVHLEPRDARSVPWRNGRGVTRELALWPSGATFERGDFNWRVARAAVTESGPFSAFPGYERTLVVTSGSALTLEHGAPARRARVRRLEPYRFSGELATHATLTDGSVEDFNVLARRTCVSADVEVLQLGRRRTRETLGAGHAFLHVLGGRVEARLTGEEAPFTLATGDSLWAREVRAGEELDLTGLDDAALALLVRIVAVRDVRA